MKNRGQDLAIQNLTVIGAGAWGTALAITGARAGLDVTLWAREENVASEINTARMNTSFLPGITLPENIKAFNDFSELGKSDCIFFVTPAQHFRKVSEQARGYIDEKTVITMCSKGIEVSSGKLMSEVAQETLPNNPFSVLSGPSFASEVANGLPTALTWAGEDEKQISDLAQKLSQPVFRIYTSTDIIGAQIGGAVKNVLAIACGIVMGKKMGANAHAALITRGFSEMRKLGQAMGSQKNTLSGLSGLGDLLLTCSSTQSRNMSLGFALGEGQSFKDILETRNTVAEGVHTSQIVSQLAQTHGVEMPICKAVEDITTSGKNVDDIINDLLSRPVAQEEMNQE